MWFAKSVIRLTSTYLVNNMRFNVRCNILHDDGWAIDYMNICVLCSGIVAARIHDWRCFYGLVCGFCPRIVILLRGEMSGYAVILVQKCSHQLTYENALRVFQ